MKKLKLIVKNLSAKVEVMTLQEQLTEAASNGDLTAVKQAIEAGADIHDGNDEALQWAAYNGHLPVVKYLVKLGSDIHADNDFALRWAAHNGYTETTEYLQMVIKLRAVNL